MSFHSGRGVALLERPVLDTSERAACSEHFPDHEALMNRLYLRHISWISQEFGIDLWSFLIDEKLSKCTPPVFKQLQYLLLRIAAEYSFKLLRLINAVRKSCAFRLGFSR